MSEETNKKKKIPGTLIQNTKTYNFESHNAKAYDLG